MLMTWLQRLTRKWSVVRERSLAGGILSGLFFLCAGTPLRLLLGANHQVDAAFGITVALCCVLVNERLAEKIPRIFGNSVCLLGAGIWTLISPLLAKRMLTLLGSLSIRTLEYPAATFSFLMLIFTICLGPVLIAIRLNDLEAKNDPNASRAQWWCGFAGALVLLPFLLFPFFGSFPMIILGLVGTGLCALSDRFTKRLSRQGVPEESSSDVAAIAGSSVLTSVSVLIPIIAGGIGGALAICLFTAFQLLPRQLSWESVLLGGLGLGLAGTFRKKSGRSAEIPAPMTTATLCLLLAAWIGVVATGYPLWTLCCLKINAWVSTLSTIILLRNTLLLLFVVPLGFLAGRLGEQQRASSRPGSWPIWMAAGFLVLPTFRSPPWVLAAGLCGLFLTIGLFLVMQHRASFLRTRRQHLGYGTLGIVALIGLLGAGRLDPELSERILLNPAALQSLRQGVAARQLSWIDDGRKRADFTSLNEHISLWTQRGSQVILRRDGIIHGLHSAHTETSPHQASDLLPVLLPLALHPDPEHVLVMGIHPPSLLTCQTWPLRTVQCVDGSREAHQMLTWLRTHADGGLHLENGPDFQFHCVNPLLSLFSRHGEQYDLIACPITQPGAPGTASELTREFYLQVRAHLAEGGIFSQRLPYYDLGPDVVRQIVKTLQSVFDDVQAVESVPGELIFLCGSKALPEIDMQFVERLKTPQTRILLGEAGWDWSLILGRGGISHSHLQQLCHPHQSPHTIRNNSLSYWLPMEVSRWGQKGNATRVALAQYGDALRTSLGDSPGGKEVTERLEDLNLAHQIQRDHPNDPWAYRAALKSRLQSRPRATIMQVNHQLKRVMDPEDQRRKEYLLELGPAATNPHPDLAAIQNLTRFEAPFDPLVSLFVYFETANLFQRCTPPLPQQQIRHLLHTVYYSSSYDQSVRNVAEALVILTKHPGALASEQRRFDEMNSLMQIMAQRWQVRLGDHRLSKYEAADTERSLLAVETALAEMQKNYSVAGMSSQEWFFRKQTLEQALLRPLRQHRSAQARQISLAPVTRKTK